MFYSEKEVLGSSRIPRENECHGEMSQTTMIACSVRDCLKEYSGVFQRKRHYVNSGLHIHMYVLTHMNTCTTHTYHKVKIKLTPHQIGKRHAPRKGLLPIMVTVCSVATFFASLHSWDPGHMSSFLSPQNRVFQRGTERLTKLALLGCLAQCLAQRQHLTQRTEDFNSRNSGLSVCYSSRVLKLFPAPTQGCLQPPITSAPMIWCPFPASEGTHNHVVYTCTDTCTQKCF